MRIIWLAAIGLCSLALCACFTVNGNVSSSANLSANVSMITSASPSPTPMPTPSVSPTPYTVCDELTYPSDIAINDSLIVVTEPSPGFLTKIFPDGRTGTLAKGLTYPIRIAPYGSGFVFLSYPDSKARISQISSSGGVSAIAEIEGYGIDDIASDGEYIFALGIKYGVENAPKVIFKISKTGESTIIFEKHCDCRLINVHNSDIYLGSDTGVSKLLPDGSLSEIVSGIEGLANFALGGQNLIISAFGGSLYQVSETGAVTRIAKKLGSLGGVALRGNDAYVLDGSGSRLLRVSF